MEKKQDYSRFFGTEEDIRIISAPKKKSTPKNTKKSTTKKSSKK